MKTTLTDKATALLNGLNKGLPAGTTATFLVAGQPVTVKQAVATLSAYLTLVGAIAPAKIAYHQAVQGAQAQRQAVEQLVTGLSKALRYLFGAGNPQLAQFGVSPGVPSKPSAATKASAVGKAQVTRQAKLPQVPKPGPGGAAPSPSGPATSGNGSGQ